MRIKDFKGGQQPQQEGVDRIDNSLELRDAVLKIKQQMDRTPNPVKIDGKTYVQRDDTGWEPRTKQQYQPVFPCKALDCEVIEVARYIQDMISQTTEVNNVKVPVLMTELVKKGEVLEKGQPETTRVFRAIKSRDYQNYQLESFLTAVPEGMMRHYELEIKLTVFNEKETK